MAKQLKRTCIFDGKTPLSKEHIFADWLEPYIPRVMSHHDTSKTLLSDIGHTTSVKKIPGDPHAKRIRCVCEACNNEWMSGIQSAVKPYLVPMLNGASIELSRRTQRLLAAWVAMATMCAEYTDRQTVAIAQTDRDRLFDAQVPPSHWRIMLGRFKRGTWRGYYVHNVLPFVEENAPKAKPGTLTPPNTQTTTLVVGEVYFHVMSSTIARRMIKRWRFPDAVAPFLTQLWPITGNLVWPPVQTMGDNEAEIVANHFYSRVIETFMDAN